MLLDKVDILRSQSHNLGCLDYVDTFQKFSKVLQACFSHTLDPSFKTAIEDFRNSYLQLNIPVTPKLHVVFFHVPDFGDRTQKGLAFYSEQAMESVHADFKSICAKYLVASHHPDNQDSRCRTSHATLHF